MMWRGSVLTLLLIGSALRGAAAPVVSFNTTISSYAVLQQATNSELGGKFGPLLVCTSANTDLGELSAAFQFAHSVCCGQLGEACDGGGGGGSGGGSIMLPSKCASPVCARALQLVSDSCSVLLNSPSFPVGGPFKGMLDSATAACVNTTTNAPQRHVITDHRPHYRRIISARAGGVLTDGMGAGGHNASDSDTAVVQASPGWVVQLTLQALWLAPHDRLLIAIDGATHELELRGHVLPPLAEGARTYRSKPGGYISTRLIVEKRDGETSFFSLAVREACSNAAGCGHGSCNATSGACSCDSGWGGPSCGSKHW